MRLYTVLLYFLQIALHVSNDTLTHHQEHTQTVITTSGTGRTVFDTVRWRGGVGTELQFECDPDDDDGWGYHSKHVELSAEI